METTGKHATSGLGKAAFRYAHLSMACSTPSVQIQELQNPAEAPEHPGAAAASHIDG